VNIFKNKVAVVTGAGSGIGKAIAEGCVKRGMKTVLADINKETLKRIEKTLQKNGGDVIAVVTDVTKQSQVKRLANKTIQTFKGVDLLINNAGILGPIDPIWMCNPKEIAKVIETNCMGAIYGLREFIPLMQKQNRPCTIVNTASSAGFCVDPYMTGYISSKHALVALTEVLYLDLKDLNSKIDVSLFCPGLVEAHIGDQFLKKKTKLVGIKKFIENFRTAKKMPATKAAEMLFQGLEARQFYIFTHFEEEKEFFKKRMKNILSRLNPSSN